MTRRIRMFVYDNKTHEKAYEATFHCEALSVPDDPHGEIEIHSTETQSWHALHHLQRGRDRYSRVTTPDQQPREEA